MNNSIVVTEENQEWYDSEGVAEYLGITKQSANSLMRTYWEFLGDKAELIGKRNKRVNRDGLLLLASMKAKTGKTKKRNDTILSQQAFLINAGIKSLKNQDTKDLENTKPNIDPFLAQLDMMRNVYLEMQTIKQEVKELKEQNLQLEPPKTLTNPQRDYINERLRNYQYNVDVPHWRLWNKLHEQVGKASINEYKPMDYKKAMSILKQWYKDANLDWN